jgi:hypothetical protein
MKARQPESLRGEAETIAFLECRSSSMKNRGFLVLVFVLTLAAAAAAQDASPQPAPPQNATGQSSGAQNGAGQSEPGSGYGQRGGFGGMGMMGRGVTGTVTEAAADHLTIKTFEGESYTIQFNGNTRFVKMPAGARRAEGEGGGEGIGQRRGMGNGGNPPQPIKVTDIKAGDVIEARGEVNATAKSVGATSVALVDPERAKQMQQMVASFGKTWLMGKVTAIDGVKVTLTGTLDNAPHIFQADENTTFRRRRDPITLADIQVGDTLRVEGAVNGGAFIATTVGDMGAGEPGAPRGRVAAPAQPQ